EALPTTAPATIALATPDTPATLAIPTLPILKGKPRKGVIQCYRCFGFNHIANACKKPQVCGYCKAEGYTGSTCKQREIQLPGCINCQGSHQAWALKCPARPKNHQYQPRQPQQPQEPQQPQGSQQPQQPQKPQGPQQPQGPQKPQLPQKPLLRTYAEDVIGRQQKEQSREQTKHKT